MVIIITLIVALPLFAFLAFQYMQEARIYIESGHIGLLISRGKAKEQALEPGVHYIWPFRRYTIQEYSLREVSYLAGDDERADGPPLEVDLVDSQAHISYLMRYRIDNTQLHLVHEYVGPSGVGLLARDYASQTIVDVLGGGEVRADEMFGESRLAIEQRLADRLTERLAERGIHLAMFGLRDVDLGSVGEIIRETARARRALTREDANAELRRRRIDNEIEHASVIASSLDEVSLRYLQIEAWREYVDRWDGRGQLPLVWPGIGDAAPRHVAAPAPAAESGADDAATSNDEERP